MIAALPVPQELDHQAVEQRFLDMLLTIRRVARYAFRHKHPAAREDLVAEVVANVYCAFLRLVARGQANLALPTTLAWFAVRQVREQVNVFLGAVLKLEWHLAPRQRYSVSR